MRARFPEDIRTVVRHQIASFDDLRIVEGVFHVVVQVFAAHFGYCARLRVSQSSNKVFSVAAELRSSPSSLSTTQSERDLCLGKRSRRLRRLYYVVARTEIE